MLRLGKLPDDFVLPPDYNVAPSTFQPVIRAGRESGEQYLGRMEGFGRRGWLQSYAIVTTDANQLMQPMPVVLHAGDYDRWLSRDETAQPPIDLLGPFETDRMTAHPVDPRVGNVGNHEPALCDAWECPPNSARERGSTIYSWGIYGGTYSYINCRDYDVSM